MKNVAEARGLLSREMERQKEAEERDSLKDYIAAGNRVSIASQKLERELAGLVSMAFSETLGEDFELSLDDEGLHVSYYASCSRCGSTFSVDEVIKPQYNTVTKPS